MKKYTISALGELLIDFTESGVSSTGMKIFEQNPGGAVGNVLAAATKFGEATAFIGKVGNDMHGLFLKQTLENAGITTEGLIVSEDTFTTLAFVALSDGERTFSFARKPGADTQLKIEELNVDILNHTKILHVGSLSLTDEPARSATYEAVKIAKQSGSIISYDPNYRASLWRNEEAATEQMRKILPLIDIIKLSNEELILLTGAEDPINASKVLFDTGIKCIVITIGAEGAFVSLGKDTAMVKGYDSKPVDTTGAGDAFWGGFLHKFIQSKKTVDELELNDVCAFAQWGNATAALCIRGRGAIPSMPSKEAVEQLIGEGK